ncbi:MAG: MlaD family protein [Bacteroidota bacterium]|nr:MlaD family protein [Bacteroidota bacterium]MDX5431169.1 MlaD family protein [Bacteroidota bacterium]MDX5469908.1 MlaD family protein [Bacteroidota bacterium]
MKISNESKVGIFAAISITILILGYNYMKGRDLFTSTRTYYAVFESVNGLVVSNPVIINGYRIGQVSDVVLRTEGDMNLLVEIEVKSKIDVPKNSTIKVISSDFFGSKAIELVLGDATEMAQNRDTLNGFMEPDLAENLKQITAPLREKVSSILEGLDSTFNGESGAALREAMEELPKTITTLNGTLTSVKTSLDSRVTELLDNAIRIERMVLDNEAVIKSTLSNLESFTDTLNALQLQHVMDQANAVLTSLDTTLQNINSGKGTLGQLAQNRSLYDEMERVSKDLDALLVELKAHPKRFVHFSIFGRKDKAGK